MNQPTMMPNPILVDQTPAGGLDIVIDDAPGGLAGVQLLSQSGPDLTVQVSAGSNFSALVYPHTLAAGETLRLIRTASSTVLSVIHAIFPLALPVGSELTLSRDGDGYLITDMTLSKDADGYLTTDRPLSRDADGYLSEGANG